MGKMNNLSLELEELRKNTNKLSEIAAIMGTSVPSVHKHKEKILKFIKENFKRG